jgi:hypothetical protein
MELREMSASYRTIVDVLNNGGHKPKRPKKWSPMTVKRIYDRETKRASKEVAGGAACGRHTY